ncbi:MAG: bifunctional diaminohydroxyphosphoribosylaminopyrimidine deaminase/5-amino-6-(5-phosphoribosylamino)uracil reductase RibD [Sulfuricellaceae bacterium]|nr:bifunctional diaminohydroxyphosphoribosylaminopyrimidine deaminase/5-amino-6-(5-phosphoribosylamino)uracil reductase RibD [Sulfuricellaceae bacterium]
MLSAADHAYMSQALRLAERGLTTTMPNPRVGCVIAADGAVVGEGWHERAGESHAEIHALRQAGVHARGATAYVTLEPCSHHGRTPPCADALVAAGVQRVVVAMRDPNPQVAGKGIQRLLDAGVSVQTGLMQAQAESLNPGFISRMTRGRPWLRLKVAATLDGKTALNNGVSQWITGPDARRDAHRLRARSCAMLTGIGTVLSDNPAFNVRDVETTRQPLKVVVDTHLRMPLDAKMLEGAPVLVATASQDATRIRALELAGAEVLSMPASPSSMGGVDLHCLLTELGRREFNEMTVEAGQVLNGALLQAGLVDELVMYMAPILFGDRARGMFGLPEMTEMGMRLDLEVSDMRMLGKDVRITARIKES